jgi:hypothetical protein
LSDWLEPEPEQTAGLPAVVALPDDYKTRLAILESCWQRLTPRQKAFLNAWRDCEFNERAACQELGLSPNTKPNSRWMEQPDYATVVRIWRANAAANALDRDRVVVRQEQIIEKALTPKPILYQGAPTGFEEIELGVAARANEVLLDRVLPKPREGIEVNVGVYAPVQVEVEQPAGATIDATVEEVEASPLLPGAGAT